MDYDFENLDVGDLITVINKFYENNKYEERYSYFSLVDLKDKYSKDNLINILYEHRHEIDNEILFDDGMEDFYTLTEEDARKRIIEFMNDQIEDFIPIIVSEHGDDFIWEKADKIVENAMDCNLSKDYQRNSDEDSLEYIFNDYFKKGTKFEQSVESLLYMLDKKLPKDYNFEHEYGDEYLTNDLTGEEEYAYDCTVTITRV